MTGISDMLDLIKLVNKFFKQYNMKSFLLMYIRGKDFFYVNFFVFNFLNYKQILFQKYEYVQKNKRKTDI
jgi:hypothetical protein